MSEWPRIKVPSPLVQVIAELRKRYRGEPIDHAVESMYSLREVVAWQLARLEQLEDVLAKKGIVVPVRCFACQSDHVQVEHRMHQRRHTCQECGYAWRFGVKEI